MRDYSFIAQVTRFKEYLESSENIVILSHTNPDGDAVGSLTGMRKFLSLIDKKAVMVLPDEYPEYLSFLDSHKGILIYDNNRSEVDELLKRCDMIIAVDFNQLSRIDSLEKPVAGSMAKKVLIDHHPDPQEDIFDLVISYIDMSSTSELIYRLLTAIPEFKSLVDANVAESLYVGMMTDTNNFSNSVTGSTFKMASDLLLLGVDKEALQQKVFGGFSENRMRLMGHALLNKMVIIDKFNVGYITISKEEQEHFNFVEGDSEGFVNLPLNINGIFISALFMEKDDHIRVSLRSINNFSVNKLSRIHFNGGGHLRAAGGRLYMDIDEVGSYFENALEQSFEECFVL